MPVKPRCPSCFSLYHAHLKTPYLKDSPVSSTVSFYYCNLSSKVYNFQTQGTMFRRSQLHPWQKSWEAKRDAKTTRGRVKVGSRCHPLPPLRYWSIVQEPGPHSRSWELRPRMDCLWNKSHKTQGIGEKKSLAPLLFLPTVIRAWHWLNITRSQCSGQPWKCCSQNPELRWGRVRNGSESSLAVGGTCHTSNSLWTYCQSRCRSFFTWT